MHKKSIKIIKKTLKYFEWLIIHYKKYECFLQ